MVDSYLKEVAYHIIHGSTNKISYLSTNWVGIGINEMNTLEGKGSFNFCNNFVVITNIVLKCEQQQIFILHPLDTSSTHAHEVHSNLHMLEEFEVKQDESQATPWF